MFAVLEKTLRVRTQPRSSVLFIKFTDTIFHPSYSRKGTGTGNTYSIRLRETLKPKDLAPLTVTIQSVCQIYPQQPRSAITATGRHSGGLDTKTVELCSMKLNTSVETRLPSLALRHRIEFHEKEFTNALRNGQPSWRVAQGSRVCNLSFGGPRGSISMFSRMTDACESDKGPPAKLTGLEYFNYHLSPLSGSAARLSETRTSG